MNWNLIMDLVMEGLYNGANSLTGYMLGAKVLGWPEPAAFLLATAFGVAGMANHWRALRKGALVVLALTPLLGPGDVQAQTPVLNPSTATWTLPTQNTDGSPFTDGKESRLKSGPCPTGPFTTRLIVPMPNPAPSPGTVVTAGSATNPIVTVLATAEGPGCAVVTVADTTGQESGPSAVVPFLRNLVPPAAPSGFQLVP